MSFIEDLSRPTSQNRIDNYTSREVASAMRTVLTHTLIDVFALDDKEALWVGYHLHTALEPLNDLKPKSIPSAVYYELQTRDYSKRLACELKGFYNSNKENAQQADLEDWVSVFIEMICSSYEFVRPMTEATLRGSITGILKELGVGKPEDGRASAYLPTMIKFALSRKEES